MTEKITRDAFHFNILHEEHKCKETRVIDELGINNGAVRADIAVLSSKIVGYEIKGFRDNLKRLPHQIEAYDQIFEESNLVVAENHYKASKELLPRWWGIFIIRSVDSVNINFELCRSSRKSPKMNSISIAQLLWKEEAIDIANNIFKYNLKASSTKCEINKILSSLCDCEELAKIVITYLKKRNCWRKDPKELLQNDDYFLPNSKHLDFRVLHSHEHIPLNVDHPLNSVLPGNNLNLQFA